MNTSAIEKFAKFARKALMQQVAQRAAHFGVMADQIYPAEVKSSDSIVIHGQVHNIDIKRQREALVKEVQSRGFEQVVEEVAYTWFNRFAALRFMEVNEYLPSGIRVFSSTDPDKKDPDILTHCLDLDFINKDKVFSLRDKRDDEGLYKHLLIAQCNALNGIMPFLFEKIQDYTELLFPDNILFSDSVIRRMVEDIPEEDWQETEIVGWLYQFYIAEKKDQVIGKVVKKEDIPAATQLFTPKWIVQYMVENSLGRLWLEMHPDSPLRQKMRYYIENPDDKDTYREPKSPEEITCIDPCCGSGHILCYMFDLLYEIYEEKGYVGRDIPSLILKHNLHGFDIDRRAAQLASFAVIMKARSKDRRFFDRKALPNVLEIQESNGVDISFLLKMDRKQLDALRKPRQQVMFGAGEGDDLFDFAAQNAATASPTAWIKGLQDLIESFYDAKNYGSLLNVDATIAARLPEIDAMLEKLAGDELFGGTAESLREFVKQATLLACQYDVCVTNPPYMGNKFYNSHLKEFTNLNFPEGKADLYGCFMLRCVAFLNSLGLTSLITIPNWMFLSSFEDIRKTLLSRSFISSLLHNGRGIWGADFGSCTFVLGNEVQTGKNGVFRRLFSRQGEVQSIAEIEANFFNSVKYPVYKASSNSFKEVPGVPIAYWLSEQMVSLFTGGIPLGSFAEIKRGMTTSDNAQFVRFWPEVCYEKCCIDAGCHEDARTSGSKWFPYSKGGGYRKWYGYMDQMVNWEDDGRDVIDFAKTINNSFTRTIVNIPYYFKPSAGFSYVTSGPFSMRWIPKGCLYDSGGPGVFAEPTKRMFVLSCLNAKPSQEMLKALNPTLNLQIADIARVPVFEKLYNDRKFRGEVCDLVKRAVRIAQSDWDSFETSWNFEQLPLLRADRRGVPLKESILGWTRRCSNSVQALLTLELENNKRWIDAYGLEKEFSPIVEEDQISLYKPDINQGLRIYLSYAVGCIMGRYSIDAPGLVFAGGDWNHRWQQYKARREKMEQRRQGDVANGELLAREEPYEIPEGCENWTHSPSFPEDNDGIIPLLDKDYFHDDGTSRIIEFLKVTFGEETLNENLEFLASALGSKSSESPIDTIHRYLATQFFKDHCQTYKKRPIYWLFTSGKERAFQALIYMHRYDKTLLARMRHDYLLELQQKLEAEARHQEDLTTSNDNKTKRQAEKELTRLRKQLAEIRHYDEKLRHAADLQIEIDLDDGVKVNYLKFQRLGLVEVIPGLDRNTDD